MVSAPRQPSGQVTTLSCPFGQRRQPSTGAPPAVASTPSSVHALSPSHRPVTPADDSHILAHTDPFGLGYTSSFPQRLSESPLPVTFKLAALVQLLRLASQYVPVDLTSSMAPLPPRAPTTSEATGNAPVQSAIHGSPLPTPPHDIPKHSLYMPGTSPTPSLNHDPSHVNATILHTYEEGLQRHRGVRQSLDHTNRRLQTILAVLTAADTAVVTAQGALGETHKAQRAVSTSVAKAGLHLEPDRCEAAIASDTGAALIQPADTHAVPDTGPLVSILATAQDRHRPVFAIPISSPPVLSRTPAPTVAAALLPADSEGLSHFLWWLPLYYRRYETLTFHARSRIPFWSDLRKSCMSYPRPRPLSDR